MYPNHQEHSEIELASNRNFGLIVGSVLTLIEGYRFWVSNDLDAIGVTLLVIGTFLVTFGILYPSILTPLNIGWSKLGVLMATIVNPIVLFIMFTVTVTPVGLLMRCFGKDPLKLRLDPHVKSYWIDRKANELKPESMKNQF